MAQFFLTHLLKAQEQHQTLKNIHCRIKQNRTECKLKSLTEWKLKSFFYNSGMPSSGEVNT